MERCIYIHKKRRKENKNIYICGNEIESVTNYPLHGLIINYSKGDFTPKTFCKKI